MVLVVDAHELVASSLAVALGHAGFEHPPVGRIPALRW